MEELPNDDDIDLDTLQAQIDVSLAHTKNLVSSWLKPAYDTSLPSSSRRAEQDKEIESLLRRPPRLGVGAPIPASTSLLAVEGVKLRNKLAGKKRQRDSEDADPSTAVHEEDSEDEGRGRAIKKKAKVDPFEAGHGKKKKQQRAEQQEALVEPSTPAPLLKVVEVTPATPVKLPETFESPSLPQGSVSERKKKKKKKHRLQESDTLPTLSHSSPVKLPDLGDSATSSPVSLKQRPEDSDPPSPEKSTKLSSRTKSTPLLNLDGPPPAGDTDEAAPSSSKKKRKRRKKKKSGAGGIAAEAEEDNGP